MTNEVLSLGLVLAWVVVAMCADVLFKKAPSLDSWQFWCGCFIYGWPCGIAAFYSYRLQQFGWLGLMWCSVSLAASLLLSVVLFSEPFTFRRGLSAVLVLVAILLIE